MKTFCKQLEARIQEDLGNIALEVDHPIKRSELSLHVLDVGLQSLKQFIVEYHFIDPAEEILFFKEIKPTIYSKLIYHQALYSLEVNKPGGNDKAMRRYLQKAQDHINQYYKQNLEFYRYYRSGMTYLDEKFFRRGQYDFRLGLDNHYADSDHRFSSSHDYRVAEMMANELLRLYLTDALEALSKPGKMDFSLQLPGQLSPMRWTAPKAALTELIYALESRHVFNNGQADLKQISDYFECVFFIDLGNIYRVFQELRIRKKGRTVFLDELLDALNNRMDDADE
ncbi:RteC protein [bacterium A37T11]|nr:RteC protein [bacterium A37T11]